MLGAYPSSSASGLAGDPRRRAVKLPELLWATEMEDETKEAIKNAVQGLLRFLDEKQSVVFSPKPYVAVPPTCICHCPCPSSPLLVAFDSADIKQALE